jgi:acyl-coenzyme A thioesterase PaaI-like protein
VSTPEPTVLTDSADVLADAVRGLLEVAVRTQVGRDDVLAAADAVEGVTALLSRDLRHGPWTPDRTDPRPSPYNAVIGTGNPLAAPLVLTAREPAGVRGHVRFGTAYEGAPGLVHGGVLSMVMDQVFGEAAIAAGVGGMTVGLEVRYAAPTPIDCVLEVDGRVVDAGERKVRLEGSIRVGGTTTVTATATFFRITAEHAQKLFPHLVRE